jgi:uncharacterized DUF497 family protein
MEFEFDPRKSQLNQEKHGIDFWEAQQLWVDVNRIEVPARTEDDVQFLVIGKIGSKHYSDSRVRLCDHAVPTMTDRIQKLKTPN